MANNGRFVGYYSSLRKIIIELEEKEISVNDNIRNIINYSIFLIFSFLTFIPILAGIIGQMIVAIGVSFTSIYLFWRILGVLFEFFHLDQHQSFFYFQGFIKIGENLDFIILLFSLILALIGSVLFIGGVIQITYVKLKKIPLVSDHFYGLIRHPQNFGIILFFFALFLFIPTTWTGHVSNLDVYWIRIGDFYSLIFFILIWILEAQWEEKLLLRSLPVEYREYKQKVPMFIPFTSKLGQFLDSFKPKFFDNLPFWKMIIIWIIFYFLFIIFFSLVIGSSIYLTR